MNVKALLATLFKDLSKKKSSDNSETKKLIETEIKKFFSTHKSRISKEELLTCLEEIFGGKESFEEIRNLCNRRTASLFKEYFQGQNPTSLSDSEIELWRTSPTGLPNTGKDQRIAYDNGWTNPQEIQNGKINYQGITDIEVLKVKKKNIDIKLHNEWWRRELLSGEEN